MSNYFNGNGTIGFTCDVCGRELNSCSIVNGMKFCAKCYQETFGKDNQQNETQELKQQLEEKEKLLKCYQDEEKLIAKILGDESLTIIGSRVHLENLIVELKNKIRDRDLIIEEKNKQIEDWKQKTQTFLNRVSEQNYEIANNNPKQLAITELEKVINIFEPYENDNRDTILKLNNNVSFIDYIEQRIKELKGE